MISPPSSPSKNLQGASRTTGGFSCGRALRNTFNIADTPDYEMDLDLSLAIPGKVYIYNSTSDLMELDPNTMKPRHILKTDVSRTIALWSLQSWPANILQSTVTGCRVK